MIAEELFKSVESELRDIEVIDVRIGLSYTSVLLENQNLGVAYSFRDEATECCEVMKNAGELEGNARDLAEMALSARSVDSSVGVATINGAINQKVEGKNVPLLDFLDVRDGEKIGMVGNFKPVVNKIEEDIELFIFERRAQDDSVYPDWAVNKILPEVDVAILTGTAVVNKTLDHLIKLSKNAREIAILGPTTPMAPTIFEKHGVTFLGGMVIEKVDKAQKIVSQGGGTRKLSKISKKVSAIL